MNYHRGYQIFGQNKYTIMTKYTLTAFLIISTLFSVANAQTFPQIWDNNQYDYAQGTKGFLRLINYQGSISPNPNKAIIFATTVLSGGSAVDKDLFRLTLAGVSTFNSPFQNYDVKVNFCSREILQGGIVGLGTGLQLFGTSKLDLGTQSQPTIISVMSDKVDFKRNLFIKNNDITVRLGLNDDETYGWIGTQTNTGLILGTGARAVMTIDANERIVYIGQFAVSEATKSKYSLLVKKGILSEDYAIAPVSSWSDFVFDPNYSLMPLAEVENYISTNKHLPDVPSAKSVAEDGYSQHEINKILLQKIEELTLYTIEQQKEIERLKELINQH